MLTTAVLNQSSSLKIDLLILLINRTNQQTPFQSQSIALTELQYSNNYPKVKLSNARYIETRKVFLVWLSITFFYRKQRSTLWLHGSKVCGNMCFTGETAREAIIKLPSLSPPSSETVTLSLESNKSTAMWQFVINQTF